jgi:hypothetical protein
MKKILSGVLAGFMAIFASISPAFAGGEDKIEILSDGTTLYYISTEHIPDALRFFNKKIEEEEKRRFSSNANWLTKICSLAAGAASCVGFSKISDLRVSVPCGIIALTVFGLTSFYPNYVDYDVDQVLNKLPRVRLNVHGRGGFARGLEGIYDELKRLDPDYAKNYNAKVDGRLYDPVRTGDGGRGIIILEKPRSAWGEDECFIYDWCLAQKKVEEFWLLDKGGNYFTCLTEFFFFSQAKAEDCMKIVGYDKNEPMYGPSVRNLVLFDCLERWMRDKGLTVKETLPLNYPSMKDGVGYF